MKRQYVVLTPIWRPQLDVPELENVSQTRAVLSAEDHLFLAPRSLDISWYSEVFPEARFIRCRDKELSSIASYNSFMLDWRFYKKFRAFEFLVIAQTDSFLTRELTSLVQGVTWDIIGAPWAQAQKANWVSIVEPSLLGPLASHLIPYTMLHVGNGGLSVRRVSPLIDVLRHFRYLKHFVRSNEDVVISFLASKCGLQVASLDEARAAFFEDGEAIPGLGDVYGYHGLDKWHPGARRAFLDSL